VACRARISHYLVRGGRELNVVAVKAALRRKMEPASQRRNFTAGSPAGVGFEIVAGTRGGLAELSPIASIARRFSEPTSFSATPRIRCCLSRARRGSHRGCGHACSLDRRFP
jgi:hypothetical protein